MDWSGIPGLLINPVIFAYVYAINSMKLLRRKVCAYVHACLNYLEAVALPSSAPLPSSEVCGDAASELR